MRKRLSKGTTMNQKLTFLSLLLLGLFTATVNAGHHRENHVSETVNIAATPAEVWKAAKDFGNLHGWHPAVQSSTNDNGNNVGSVRVLDLGGPTITEKLLSFSNTNMSFTYQIAKVDPAVLPVQNYVSWFSVKSDGNNGSTVTWMGDFGTVGEAAPADVKKGVSGIYRAGLDNLKNMFESENLEEAPVE